MEGHSLQVCGLSVLKVEPPDLFAKLTSDCHPIAIKSRRYNHVDREFIGTEIQRLLKEGITEPSDSRWRAQVVVTLSKNHERRLVITYSQTISCFTMLDAYPLPRITILSIISHTTRLSVQLTYKVLPTKLKSRTQTKHIQHFRMVRHCKNSL